MISIDILRRPPPGCQYISYFNFTIVIAITKLMGYDLYMNKTTWKSDCCKATLILSRDCSKLVCIKCRKECKTKECKAKGI